MLLLSKGEKECERDENTLRSNEQILPTLNPSHDRERPIRKLQLYTDENR